MNKIKITMEIEKANKKVRALNEIRTHWKYDDENKYFWKWNNELFSHLYTDPVLQYIKTADGEKENTKTKRQNKIKIFTAIREEW